METSVILESLNVMKYILSLIFLFFALVSGLSQANFSAVMSDTNGAVQRPTNFWTANSNSINSVISNSAPSFTPVDYVYKVQQYFFGNNTIESNNATISDVNSSLTISIAETNTNASGAVRLIANVNSSSLGGVGTKFANDSHTAWLRFEALPRESGLARFVLGTPSNPSTNIAAYPTNRAFGFELKRLGGDTNEIRLIAHNGTTNTNGPWVAIGDIFQEYTIGVRQNKTNGEMSLFVGLNQNAPTINTNATISGGPTNNAGNLQSALEVGLFTTNTNAGSISLIINSALVEITD